MNRNPTELIRFSHRTLYVGNLDLQVTEELVMAMFGQMGTVRSCKIIREPANINAEPYGFVEFADHSAAAVSILECHTFRRSY